MTSLALGACSSYRPATIATLRPGTYVRLTASNRSPLSVAGDGSVTNPCRAGRVEGVVEQVEGQTLRLRSTRRANATDQRYAPCRGLLGGTSRITIADTASVRADTRHFSGGKTTLLVGGVLGVVYVMALGAAMGSLMSY